MPQKPDSGIPDVQSALERLTGLIQREPALQGAKLQRPLTLTASDTAILGTLNGDKVVFQLFLGAEAAARAEAQKAELDQMAAHLEDGPHQVPHCRMVLPEHGLTVLEFIGGKSLAERLPEANDQKRRQMLSQAGMWLKRYAMARRRKAHFGAPFWVETRGKRLAKINDSNPQALALLDTLRRRAETLRGAMVWQAAGHGQFTPANLKIHKGTFYGINILGENWSALARELAGFLVDVQITCPNSSDPAMRYGIAEADLLALLKRNVLDADETHSILPFFIGVDILDRLITEARSPQLDDVQHARLASLAKAFIESPITPDAYQ